MDSTGSCSFPSSLTSVLGRPHDPYGSSYAAADHAVDLTVFLQSAVRFLFVICSKRVLPVSCFLHLAFSLTLYHMCRDAVQRILERVLFAFFFSFGECMTIRSLTTRFWCMMQGGTFVAHTRSVSVGGIHPPWILVHSLEGKSSQSPEQQAFMGLLRHMHGLSSWYFGGSFIHRAQAYLTNPPA